MFTLNDINMTIRFKEMKIYLQKSDREESSIDHIRLVMKYNLYKQMYDERITQDKADVSEFKIDSLLKEKSIYDKIKIPKYEYMSVPALYLINFNRFLLGKESIRDYIDQDSVSYIEIAYYYERNNYYTKALENYEKALATGNLDRSIRASIMLHQGFCYALLGDYEKAKNHYNRIINTYSSESVAITATILLRYLEGFHSEHKKILNMEKDSISKSEKLYKLLAYKESLAVLNKEESSAKPSQLARIRYYKARCYNELGRTKKSVNTYLRVITSSPASEYARLSNRRIYIIGSRLSNDNNIKKTAVKLNSVLKDEILDSMIIRETNIKSDITPEIDINKIKIAEDLAGKIKNLLSVKRIIDYTGQKIRIKTVGGNIFIGSVIKSDYSNISMMTIIGRIKVKRNKIRDIEILEKDSL